MMKEPALSRSGYYSDCLRGGDMQAMAAIQSERETGDGA